IYRLKLLDSEKRSARLVRGTILESMTESTFLSGKVLRRSLPVVQPASGSGAPSLKRLLLPQGELAQFYDGEEPIRYLAYIELRPGVVRGNHYHKVKE